VRGAIRKPAGKIAARGLAVTREQLFERATDPRQYDAPGLDWRREGAPGSHTARFVEAWLSPELERLRFQSAVDIGCGTGHLYPLLHRLGARRVAGIEPAAANAAFARRAFPALEVIESPLQDVSLPDAFDLAIVVMSFEHQPDLAAAFRSVHRLLLPGGSFALIAGEPEFHLTPRFGLGIESHALADGSFLVATAYPYGTVHDIVRPPEHYVDAARAAAFAIRRRIAMAPTPELIESDPRWCPLELRTVAHLFVMTRD